jgi:hypothetical protein
LRQPFRAPAPERPRQRELVDGSLHAPEGQLKLLLGKVKSRKQIGRESTQHCEDEQQTRYRNRFGDLYYEFSLLFCFRVYLQVDGPIPPVVL